MTRDPLTAPVPDARGQVDRLVQVMDRLRGAGGCPWDAAQDHRSLVQYLLEEAYEVVDAIESNDPTAMREELGDLLLQVVFHAAIARERPSPFDLDDIAGDVADKLIRRHPQVFGATDDAGTRLTAEQSYARWDLIKAEEKARTSVLDGIPRSQGALARTQKVIRRSRRGGLNADRLAAGEAGSPRGDPPIDRAENGTDVTSPDVEVCVAPEVSADIGGRLLALVFEAEAAGVEAETALRAASRVLEERIRAAEATAAPGGAPPPGS